MLGSVAIAREALVEVLRDAPKKPVSCSRVERLESERDNGRSLPRSACVSPGIETLSPQCESIFLLQSGPPFSADRHPNRLA